MPTLHMICGLPGAGKSTLAARLERDNGALRLTPDDWIARLYNSDGRDPDVREAIEGLQLGVALRVLALGLDVVLDNGFWTRADRDRYRAAAASVGAEARLYFLDVPHAELNRRLALRNADPKPGTFLVFPEDIALWSTWLEAPTADEPGLTPIPEAY